MVCYQLASIGKVFLFMQYQIVADAAADEALLHQRMCIDGTVKLDEGGVVGVEVLTNGRMEARGTTTAFAKRRVTTSHTIHIRGGSSEVGDVAFEVGHLRHLLNLAQHALFAATDNELALMSRDGAEGTATETAPM